ncbi:hypothetical protein RhiirB3_441614 [Rhizophagus irregularis]|nr:hypothetical protein RhiirB3_441614 [Rhizophagus irregularis]
MKYMDSLLLPIIYPCFLNLNASKINPEIWASSENNTNAIEATHALANWEGKQLKLLTAIIRDIKLMNKLGSYGY